MIQLIVKHLPTGTEWKSIGFKADEYDTLHDLCQSCTELYLDTDINNRVYIRQTVLKECTLTLRRL